LAAEARRNGKTLSVPLTVCLPPRHFNTILPSYHEM
jgi:hypothetical protein